MILIESPDGSERAYVHSLAGYEGWTILKKRVAEPKDNPLERPSVAHMASVHAQKALEATMILSGYDLTAGLLAAEAEALGIPLKDLAQQVHERRADERAFEIQRRIFKKGTT